MPHFTSQSLCNWNPAENATKTWHLFFLKKVVDYQANQNNQFLHFVSSS